MRRAVSLVELLVAMAITLLIMGAVVQVFAMISGSVASSRSVLEMSNLVRGARNVMQNDLAGVTCPVRPWLEPEDNQGYFEYYEGQRTDNVALMDSDFGPSDWAEVPWGNAKSVHRSLLGDFDDVLMFTARSLGEPFVGWGRVRVGNSNTFQRQIVTSEYAEIIWFAVQDPDTGMRTIYRRTFLIRPDLMPYEVPYEEYDDDGRWLRYKVPGWRNLVDNGAPLGAAEYWQTDDVASRLVMRNGRTYRAPCSLQDLTRRENRAAHNADSPPALQLSLLVPLTGSRAGEDVVLSNALAFDVRAFDPLAPLFSVNGSIVAPGDPGYRDGAGGVGSTDQPVGYGAFVDLNYGRAQNFTFGTGNSVRNASHFSTFTYALDLVKPNTANHAIYDTWPTSYAKSASPYGFGSEWTASAPSLEPPYSVPLRGVQVTFRTYEPDSRSTREVSVVQDFVAE